MRWKASCSDLFQLHISLALIRENFRRFWAIPVLSFLCYFLSGPFLLLLNYGRLSDNTYLVNQMLHDGNVGFVLLHALVPVISAVAVFRYLQQPGVVTTAHALPFSRSTLFNTGFLSGLLMTALPVLANGLVFFLIKTPVYVDYAEGDPLPLFTEVTAHPVSPADYPNGAYDAFSCGAILEWVLSALLIVLFFYAVAVFAGAVTGTSLLHFSFGLWFNFLLPMVWLCLTFYFDLFFFGYSDSGSVQEVFQYMNPLLLRVGASSLSPSMVIAFLAAAVVVVLLSKWLYFNRPMERAGDALVFRFLQPLLCSLMAFLSMTFFGLYFKEAFGARYPTVLGLGAGAVLGFLIGRMVVMKTLQIFNRKTVQCFAAFAAVCALLMASFAFDLYGYETRVPDEDSVQSVYFPTGELFGNGLSIDADSSDDLAVISHVTAIHREFLAQRELIESAAPSRTYHQFIYTMNNGWKSARRYRLPYEFLYRSEALRAYYNSPQRHQAVTEFFDSLGSIAYLQLNGYPVNLDAQSGGPQLSRMDEYSYENLILYPNEYDLTGFLAAVEEDLLTMDYAQAIMEAPELLRAELTYYPAGDAAPDINRSLYISVTPQMSHTLQWLSRQNICDPLEEAVNLTAAVLVTPRGWDEENNAEIDPLPAATETELTANRPVPLVKDKEELSGLTAAYRPSSALPGDGTGEASAWDGDTVYRYSPETGYLQPVSLKQLEAQSEGSLLITDPEDIRQLLLHAESWRNTDRDIYQLTFLSRTDDGGLYRSLNQLYLSKGALDMEECDLAVSPQLQGFLDSAL